jgi:hypothetical protein
MSIIVHIGYPKTATSWLQKRLFPFVENFIFVDRRDIIERFIKPYALNFDPQQTRDFFLEKYGSDLILSLEGFLGNVHNFGLNGYLTMEHANRIFSVFPEARIILFLRRQPDIIASFYYQYIAGGGNYSLKSFLNHKTKQELNGISLFSYEFFEYHHTLKLYHKLFSQEQVYTYLFEEFQEDTKTFIERFCKDHKFQIAQSNIDYRPVLERFRIGIKHLFFISNLFTYRRIMNKYYIINIPYWFPTYKLILNRLRRYKIFGPRPSSIKILKENNYNFIMEYYKRSNRKLIEMYGLNGICKYDYPL